MNFEKGSARVEVWQVIWLIILVIVVLGLAAVATTLWLVKRRLVRWHQTADKMATPTQIAGAQRFYVRTIYRRQHVMYLRRIMIGLFVLAGFMALWALCEQFNLYTTFPNGRAAMNWFLSDHTSTRNVALVLMIFSVLGASLLRFLLLKRVDEVQVAEANESAHDIYAIPAVMRRQLFGLRRLLLIGLLIISLWLGLGAVTKAIPRATSPFETSHSITQPIETNSATSGSSSDETSYDDSGDSSSSPSSSSAASDAAESSNSNDATDDDLPMPSTPIADVVKAKPADNATMKQLSEADQASLTFMAYWAMEGQNPATLFATKNSTGGATFYYHWIANNGHPIIMFNSYSPVAKAMDDMFIANIAGNDVSFYSLHDETAQTSKLANIMGLTMSNGYATPSQDQLDQRSYDLRKMATVYYQQAGYQAVHDTLKPGYAMTLK